MMGTLAAVLATRGIATGGDRFRADVEGEIRDVEGVLKITLIRVVYHLAVERGKEDDARRCLPRYLEKCPAAQSVTGCITIEHRLQITSS